MNRIHPFVGRGMLGALALRPGGSMIALRFGSPGPGAQAGLFDPQTTDVRPLAPDDDSRAAWILALAEAAEPDAEPFERPTRLPFPAERDPSERIPPGIRRLATTGRALCDEISADIVPPRLRARPVLFFNYLLGGYEEADRALDQIIDAIETPDAKLRALGLRAQIALALDRTSTALEIIEFVREEGQPASSRVEPSGSGGLVVTGEVDGSIPWPEALWQLHRDRLERRGEGSGATPTTREVGPPPGPQRAEPPPSLSP